MSIAALNLTQTSVWGPWLVDAQVAGTHYADFLRFVRFFNRLQKDVHGPRPLRHGQRSRFVLLVVEYLTRAGHMVPTYKPAQGLALFKKFLANTL